MAVLSNADRVEVRKTLMTMHHSWDDSTLLKGDIEAAANAIDDWIDGNQASFNAALPLPARTALTAKEKVMLFVKVVTKRWEVEV